MTTIPNLRWLVFAALLPTFAMASTDGNSPPQSEAGYARTVMQGETVRLDGSRSYDNDDDPLTYEWTLIPPLFSMAELSDPTAVKPTFVADVPGEYLIVLIVNDGKVDSEPCEVIITAESDGRNIPPIADAGEYVPRPVGRVDLDGTGSDDPDGPNDALMYMWTLVESPDPTAMLSDPMSATPTFEATVPGTYTVSLIVNDGIDSSPADTATIEVLPPSMVGELSIGNVDLPPEMSSFQFPIRLEGMPGAVTVQYQVVVIDAVDTEFFNMQDGEVTFAGLDLVEVELTNPPGTRFAVPPEDFYFCVFIGNVMPPEAALIVDEVGIGIIRNNDPGDNDNIPDDACDMVPNPFAAAAEAPESGGSPAVTEAVADSGGDAATPSASSALGTFGLLCLAGFAAWRRRLPLGV